MKRFHWPLQRLLTVTYQRELAMRSQLLLLLQQVTRIRQEIVRRKAMMRSVLSDLSEAGFERRIALQELLMRCLPWFERETGILDEKINELTAQRVEKTTLLVKLRKRKETLERMRTESRQEHIREQLKLEQKEFDQNAQIAFVRETKR